MLWSQIYDNRLTSFQRHIVKIGLMSIKQNLKKQLKFLYLADARIQSDRHFYCILGLRAQ